MNSDIWAELRETERVIVEATEKLFTLHVEKLKQGTASYIRSEDNVALLSVDEQAAEMVEEICLHIQEGLLTPTMKQLLMAHLRALNSKERWALLGLSNSHRRLTREGQISSACNSYLEAIRVGKPEKEAMIDAYNSYFAAGPELLGRARPTYEGDLKYPGNRYANKAEQRMATVVRRALSERDLVAPGVAGRPKNTK